MKNRRIIYSYYPRDRTCGIKELDPSHDSFHSLPEPPLLHRCLIITLRIWGGGHFKAPTFQIAIIFIKSTHFQIFTFRQMTYIYC